MTNSILKVHGLLNSAMQAVLFICDTCMHFEGAWLLDWCLWQCQLQYRQALGTNVLLVWLAASQQQPQQPPVVTGCSGASCSSSMQPAAAGSNGQPISGSTGQPNQASIVQPNAGSNGQLNLPSTQGSAGTNGMNGPSGNVAPDGSSTVGSTSTHPKLHVSPSSSPPHPP